MSTQFDNMNKSELKEACEDFGLEVAEPKTAGKPTNAEYIEVLVAFKAQQDAVHGVEEVDDTEVDDTPTETKEDTPRRKPQTAAQLLKLDVMLKEYVIVHDQQDSQTKDELIPVSWGNRAGCHTEWVSLNGEPQYIRRGALGNLREASMAIQEPVKNGGSKLVLKKRFIIVPLDGLTDDELAELATKQRIRNSKIS